MIKILSISNMYPSQKYPHYGIFVKHINEQLNEFNCSVKVLKIEKSDFILKKIFNYSYLYSMSLLYILFGKFDYIYIHYPAMTGIPVLLAKKIKKNIKIITNIHGNDLVPETKKDEKYISITKSVIAISEKIIVPSEYFKKIALRAVNNKEKKIYVYPSGGVDLNIFKNINKQEACKVLSLNEKFNYIGFISRIEPNKGWDLFLKAFKVSFGDDSNYKAIIVGEGSEYNDMMKLIKKLNLGGKVILINFVSQKIVNYYINVLDLFCFPTKRESESLGLIGLEAMAAETIVVASDKFGPSSYIKDGENGFSFETNNYKDLSKKMIKANRLTPTQKTELKKNALITSKKYSKIKIKYKLAEVVGVNLK